LETKRKRNFCLQPIDAASRKSGSSIYVGIWRSNKNLCSNGPIFKVAIQGSGEKIWHRCGLYSNDCE